MNNYLVYKLQYYFRKSFFKKMSLQITFKNSKIGSASKIWRKIIAQFWWSGHKGSIAKSRESPEIWIWKQIFVIWSEAVGRIRFKIYERW